MNEFILEPALPPEICLALQSELKRHASNHKFAGLLPDIPDGQLLELANAASSGAFPTLEAFVGQVNLHHSRGFTNFRSYAVLLLALMAAEMNDSDDRKATYRTLYKKHAEDCGLPLELWHVKQTYYRRGGMVYYTGRKAVDPEVNDKIWPLSYLYFWGLRLFLCRQQEDENYNIQQLPNVMFKEFGRNQKVYPLLFLKKHHNKKAVPKAPVPKTKVKTIRHDDTDEDSVDCSFDNAAGTGGALALDEESMQGMSDLGSAAVGALLERRHLNKAADQERDKDREERKKDREERIQKDKAADKQRERDQKHQLELIKMLAPAQPPVQPPAQDPLSHISSQITGLDKKLSTYQQANSTFQRTTTDNMTDVKKLMTPAAKSKHQVRLFSSPPSGSSSASTGANSPPKTFTLRSKFDAVVLEKNAGGIQDVFQLNMIEACLQEAQKEGEDALDLERIAYTDIQTQTMFEELLRESFTMETKNGAGNRLIGFSNSFLIFSLNDCDPSYNEDDYDHRVPSTLLTAIGYKELTTVDLELDNGAEVCLEILSEDPGLAIQALGSVVRVAASIPGRLKVSMASSVSEGTGFIPLATPALQMKGKGLLFNPDVTLVFSKGKLSSSLMKMLVLSNATLRFDGCIPIGDKEDEFGSFSSFLLERQHVTNAPPLKLEFSTTQDCLPTIEDFTEAMIKTNSMTKKEECTIESVLIEGRLPYPKDSVDEMEEGVHVAALISLIKTAKTKGVGFAIRELPQGGPYQKIWDEARVKCGIMSKESLEKEQVNIAAGDAAWQARSQKGEMEQQAWKAKHEEDDQQPAAEQPKQEASGWGGCFKGLRIWTMDEQIHESEVFHKTQGEQEWVATGTATGLTFGSTAVGSPKEPPCGGTPPPAPSASGGFTFGDHSAAPPGPVIVGGAPAGAANFGRGAPVPSAAPPGPFIFGGAPVGEAGTNLGGAAGTGPPAPTPAATAQMDGGGQSGRLSNAAPAPAPDLGGEGEFEEGRGAPGHGGATASSIVDDPVVPSDIHVICRYITETGSLKQRGEGGKCEGCTKCNGRLCGPHKKQVKRDVANQCESCVLRGSNIMLCDLHEDMLQALVDSRPKME